MERDFKGVWIPREVWLDERLNALEKIILVEIDSLDVSNDHCWKSNENLAAFCQCSATKVSNAISKLIELGYIKVASFDGRTRRLQSCLTVSTREPYKNCKAESQNLQVSNTKSNTKSISTTRKREPCDFTPGFTRFWTAYPRKVAKQNAYKAWGKTGAEDSEALTETIIADVNRRADGEWKGKDPQYIPHPTTYLNQRRWEDEVTEQEDDEYYPRYPEYHEGDEFIEPAGCRPVGAFR